MIKMPMLQQIFKSESIIPLLDEEFHLPLVVAKQLARKKTTNKLDELSQKYACIFQREHESYVHALTKNFSSCCSPT